MKLLSLRLHPFGGTIDRTYKFSENIQVLEGANEYGKSTFRAALMHVMFTEAKLSPVKTNELLGPWFPKSGGDFAQVTLYLESNKKLYKVKKCWGSQTSCSIKNETDNFEIADPNTVSSTLREILGHNQAIWENIFITQQDSITTTIEKLRENPSIVQNAGIEVLANDVNPEALETEINSKLKKIGGNWDWDQQVPKKDNQSLARGIDNKWMRGVGDILKAWYEWKESEKSLNDRLIYDMEVDRINNLIQLSDEVIAKLNPTIQQNTKIRDTIYQRKALENELAKTESYLVGLSKCNADWPVFENQYKLNKIEIDKKQEQLNELAEELKNAISRAESASLLENLDKIEGIQKDIAEMVFKESNIKKIDLVIFQKLKNIENELRELDLKIKAQSLIATLNSNLNFDFTVTTGTDAPRKIKLITGSEQKFEASGKIQIQGHDLTIIVSSSQTDIDLLINDLSSKKKEKENLLSELGLESLQDANNAAEAEKKLKDEISKKREMLSNLMGTRKESDLEELRTNMSDLPQTRSSKVISDLQSKTIKEKAEMELKQANMKSSVDDWELKWKDKNGLLQEIIKVGMSQTDITRQLEALPNLPEDFETESFLNEFKLDSENLENAKDTKLILHSDFYKLSQSETRDIDELIELKNEKLSSFNRENEQGKALKRILSVMKSLQPDTDLYLGLHEHIRENFKKLTNGKYINLDHKKGLPEKVGHNTITLETALLSQGTRTSLALAVRLSLAELYLEKSKAFIVMDDPFVDLDSSRREAGINLLRNLGERTQIIYLTCHSNHATEITPNRVEVKDA